MRKEDLNILNVSEELKIKLEEYSKLLYSNINSGLSLEYERTKTDMINWIEEIEFTIQNYPCQI